MAKITLSITDCDNDEMMLVGYVFPAADLVNPSAPVIVLRPTLQREVDLPPNIYFYRFNAAAGGKFNLRATIEHQEAQSRTVEVTKDGADQFHRSFRFKVNT